MYKALTQSGCSTGASSLYRTPTGPRALESWSQSDFPQAGGGGEGGGGAPYEKAKARGYPPGVPGPFARAGLALPRAINFFGFRGKLERNNLGAAHGGPGEPVTGFSCVFPLLKHAAALLLAVSVSGCGTLAPNVTTDVKDTVANYYSANSGSNRFYKVLEIVAADAATGLSITGVKSMTMWAQAEPIRALPDQPGVWSSLFGLARWGVLGYFGASVVEAIADAGQVEVVDQITRETSTTIEQVPIPLTQ